MDALLVSCSKLFQYLCEEERHPLQCWQGRAKYNTGFVIGKKLALCSSYRIIVNIVIVSGSGGFGYCLRFASKGRECSTEILFQCCSPHSLLQEEERFLLEELLFLQKMLRLTNANIQAHWTWAQPSSVWLGFHQTETKLHTCCKWKKVMENPFSFGLWKRKLGRFYGQTTCCMLTNT